MKSKQTKSDLIKEIINCGKDPVYFIKKYGKIQHPVKGLIPFTLYPYQEDVVSNFISYRKNIILKARQLGISTVTAAYIAWFILFHRDKNVLIVATKQDVSKNMIKIIRNIFRYIPKWMLDMGKIKIDNRHSIELENGSTVKAVTTSGDVGRSEAVSFLVIDECAFIQNFDEIWTGLSPTISTGGAIALFSSPNGTGNAFHSLFVGAQNDENGFNCKLGHYVNPRNPDESYDDRLMWWVHPEHDEVWFEAETRDKSPREVNQEFLCAFNASGDTFIYHEDIARAETYIKDPVRTWQTDRNLWIWEEPHPDGSYLIAADVSRGDAKDFSGFHILRLDVHPLRQVAEYKGKVRPDQLGILLASVGEFYHNAVIAPENNSGWAGQTILKLNEAKYPYLYYSRKRKPKQKNLPPPDPFYAQNRNDYLPGYSVTSANRVQMLAKLEQYVRMGDIILRSSRLINEFKTFVMTTENRPEAMRGYNDDLIMALAGALWVREEAFLYTYRSDEMTKAIMESMSTSKTSVRNFSDFNFSTSPHNRGVIREHVQQQNKIILADGSEMDLSWLITSG